MTKNGLEKEILRYTKNEDTFTARNLLNNWSDQIKGFDREKYLKLIEEAENENKKDLKEE